MGFIGELPGLIYDPEKKKYFKKAPVETRKHIQPHAFVPTISPSSLLQPLIYSQIYDKNYCPRQPESIIVGSLPNPVEIQYPYIKLFVSPFIYWSRMSAMMFIVGMPFHLLKKSILLDVRFHLSRRIRISSLLNLTSGIPGI